MSICFTAFNLFRRFLPNLGTKRHSALLFRFGMTPEFLCRCRCFALLKGFATVVSCRFVFASNIICQPPLPPPKDASHSLPHDKMAAMTPPRLSSERAESGCIHFAIAPSRAISIKFASGCATHLPHSSSHVCFCFSEK